MANLSGSRNLCGALDPTEQSQACEGASSCSPFVCGTGALCSPMLWEMEQLNKKLFDITFYRYLHSGEGSWAQKLP